MYFYNSRNEWQGVRKRRIFDLELCGKLEWGLMYL